MNGRALSAINVFDLDKDVAVALKKLEEIHKLNKKMPKMDCGSCGAPTCMALAEDIVQGKAKIEDCMFMRGARVKGLANEMFDLSAKWRPSIGKDIV